MQLDLNYVRSFVAVIREGSFAAAARATSLPTSSLSRYISRLEAQAGVRLVERTTRSLRMTEAGRLLYDRARSMVADMVELETSLERHHTTFQGVLIELDLAPAPLEVVASYASRYYQVPKAKALLAAIRAGLRDLTAAPRQLARE